MCFVTSGAGFKQYYQATGATEYAKLSLTYANEFTATYSTGGTITGPDTTFDAMYLTYTAATAPSPTGTVYFDGRAKLMNTLFSYETTPGDLNTLTQGQSPNIWTCLCFTKNDISLVLDGTYGKAYKAAAATGDTN